MRAHDLTIAVRHLVRRPLFSATAILLMALAAGANAAVFSVVRGVLLKPLPYAQPDRLVAIWPDGFVSHEEVAYWRDHTRAFKDIAAQSPGWLMAFVADGYEPLKVTGAQTTDNFFRLLGVNAVFGRALEPGDSTPGRRRVVVISHDLFVRHFHSDASVVGLTVHVDGTPHEIVGVLPRDFEFLEPGTDVWAPLTVDPRDRAYKATFNQGFARLSDAATAEGATRELVGLVPSMRHDLGKPGDWGATLRAQPLQETLTAPLQPTLLIMLAAVGLILLLAAVNLGTLVLGRTIGRAREIAVRAALGASRWRLVRQLVVEQSVLALAGTLSGLAIARLALPLLLAAVPPELPRQREITLDAAVFVIVLLVSVGIAVGFALLPIVLVSRPDTQPLLRQTHVTDSRERQRALGALVAAQVGLAVLLGIGAGLMLRSLWNLQHVNPGFEPHAVLTFRLQTTSKFRRLADGLPYLQQVIDRVRALPGVASVGSIQHLPLTGYNWTSQVVPVERPVLPGTTPPTAIWRFIGWDYFEAMRVPLRAGRLFTRFDTASAAPVMIVNEAFARKEYGSATAAVGHRIRTMNGAGTAESEIVGVVGDVRFMALDQPSRPEVYRPLAQSFMFPMAFVVRTTGSPAALAAAVRQAAYEVDPAVPVAEMQPLDVLLGSTLGRPRLLTMLLSVFAATGLLLAIVGIYGSAAYWVRRREREFGIRIALGARPGGIARGVLRQSAAVAITGIAFALPAAYALARLMRSVTYGIDAHDPITFASLPLAALGAAVMAAYLPARRAARVDPAATMRAE